MKRHEALAELSRDHHHVLVQAMALKRVSARTAAPTAEAFVGFFEEQGERHFSIEEQVLLPFYVAEAGLAAAADPVVGQVLREHVELRALVELLRRGGVGEELSREVGQRLDAHVRLEERELFPTIQLALTEEQMQRLAEAVRAAEAEGA